MIVCGSCGKGFHSFCVGEKRIPHGLSPREERDRHASYMAQHFGTDWLCPRCQTQAARASPSFSDEPYVLPQRDFDTKPTVLGGDEGIEKALATPPHSPGGSDESLIDISPSKGGESRHGDGHEQVGEEEEGGDGGDATLTKSCGETDELEQGALASERTSICLKLDTLDKMEPVVEDEQAEDVSVSGDDEGLPAGDVHEETKPGTPSSILRDEGAGGDREIREGVEPEIDEAAVSDAANYSVAGSGVAADVADAVPDALFGSARAGAGLDAPREELVRPTSLPGDAEHMMGDSGESISADKDAERPFIDSALLETLESDRGACPTGVDANHERDVGKGAAHENDDENRSTVAASPETLELHAGSALMVSSPREAGPADEEDESSRASALSPCAVYKGKTSVEDGGYDESDVVVADSQMDGVNDAPRPEHPVDLPGGELVDKARLEGNSPSEALVISSFQQEPGTLEAAFDVGPVADGPGEGDLNQEPRKQDESEGSVVCSSELSEPSESQLAAVAFDGLLPSAACEADEVGFSGDGAGMAEEASGSSGQGQPQVMSIGSGKKAGAAFELGSEQHVSKVELGGMVERSQGEQEGRSFEEDRVMLNSSHTVGVDEASVVEETRGAVSDGASLGGETLTVRTKIIPAEEEVAGRGSVTIDPVNDETSAELESSITAPSFECKAPEKVPLRSSVSEETTVEEAELTRTASSFDSLERAATFEDHQDTRRDDARAERKVSGVLKDAASSRAVQDFKTARGPTRDPGKRGGAHTSRDVVAVCAASTLPTSPRPSGRGRKLAAGEHQATTPEQGTPGTPCIVSPSSLPPTTPTSPIQSPLSAKQGEQASAGGSASQVTSRLARTGTSVGRPPVALVPPEDKSPVPERVVLFRDFPRSPQSNKGDVRSPSGPSPVKRAVSPMIASKSTSKSPCRQPLGPSASREVTEAARDPSSSSPIRSPPRRRSEASPGIRTPDFGKTQGNTRSPIRAQSAEGEGVVTVTASGPSASSSTSRTSRREMRAASASSSRPLLRRSMSSSVVQSTQRRSDSGTDRGERRRLTRVEDEEEGSGSRNNVLRMEEDSAPSVRSVGSKSQLRRTGSLNNLNRSGHGQELPEHRERPASTERDMEDDLDTIVSPLQEQVRRRSPRVRCARLGSGSGSGSRHGVVTEPSIVSKGPW